jgi:hypothetical protein
MNYLILAIHSSEFIQLIKTYRLENFNKVVNENSGYGITFLTEPIQPYLPEHKLVYPFLEVDKDSVAYKAGIKYGQRLIAVNDYFINKDLNRMSELVAYVEFSYKFNECTEFKVIDPDVWFRLMNNPSYLIQFIDKNPKKEFNF